MQCVQRGEFLRVFGPGFGVRTSAGALSVGGQRNIVAAVESPVAVWSDGTRIHARYTYSVQFKKA